MLSSINNINLFKLPKINNVQPKAAKPVSFGIARDTFEKGYIINGSETSAKVYTTNADYQTLGQIKEFCNHPVFKDAPIRIMPDTHAGVNSVVGFSAPVVNGKVIPDIIGGDIGCGVLCVKFDTGGKEIDFKKLDDIIKTYVSSGRTDTPSSMKKVPETFYKKVSDITKHKYKKSPDKIISSLGTLGGGNHFIEIDKNDKGEHFLVIHTGSRLFGKETGSRYSQTAQEQNPYRNKGLSYLSGDEAKEYLEDMKLAAQFSKYNRRVIADEIIKRMGWKETESFECIHNYISDDGMIRKGAISAQEGERLIIPLNMRDGSLIGKGKGNADWNATAPHGAGRQYKRSVAGQFITLEDYKRSMQGIHSCCIDASHIDESPDAYKDAGEIIENITETADAEDIISPIYNYKD